MEKKSLDSKKLTLIYLQQLFLKRTDETHFIRMPDIIGYMEEREIYVDRRTIYKDIKLLNYVGFEIVGVQEKGGYKYHHPSRMFSDNELKFLIDSVAASKFLTEGKSKELIGKIKTLGSSYANESLNRHVLLGKRVKSMRDIFFKNLDVLYNAISINSQIEFDYIKEGFKQQIESHKIAVSPCAISLNEENYYLIAYDKNIGILKHYRVDKMKNIVATLEAREGKEIFKNFDVVEHTNKTFGMYGGKEITVKIEAHKNLIGVFKDRFGDSANIRPSFDDDNAFVARLTVYVSPQFYGWLFGLGNDVKILEPEEVRKEYLKKLKEAAARYK